VGRDPRVTPARQPSTLLMSGERKRSVAARPKLPRLSSTLLAPSALRTPQAEVGRCGGDLRNAPTKRKRPWGAGVFVVNLGVVGVLIIHVATLGGCKEPREFGEFSSSVRLNCLNS
jgi:hypothetical protein